MAKNSQWRWRYGKRFPPALSESIISPQIISHRLAIFSFYSLKAQLFSATASLLKSKSAIICKKKLHSCPPDTFHIVF